LPPCELDMCPFCLETSAEYFKALRFRPTNPQSGLQLWMVPGKTFAEGRAHMESMISVSSATWWCTGRYAVRVKAIRVDEDDDDAVSIAGQFNLDHN
jgi:hypothetical protein